MLKYIVSLMLGAFIYINSPVSALQMDIDTEGSAEYVGTANKQIASNRINGKLRVIVYGLNQETFEGRVISIDGDIVSIENIHGSDPDGLAVDVEVDWVNSPKNLKILRE